MGKIIVVYRGTDKFYKRPEIGERYVIHKPADVYESPSWIDYMDKFNGYTIEIIDRCGDDRNKIDKYNWIAEPVYHEYNDINYYFNISWLEKIDNFSDLDESTVNFFDI